MCSSLPCLLNNSSIRVYNTILEIENLCCCSVSCRLVWYDTIHISSLVHCTLYFTAYFYNHAAHPHSQPLQIIFLVLQALTGECGFLAANLYTRSIFGEDALANLSIERRAWCWRALLSLGTSGLGQRARCAFVCLWCSVNVCVWGGGGGAH